MFEPLCLLQVRAQQRGVHVPFSANTPYINTISVGNQPVFPGSRENERRIYLEDRGIKKPDDQKAQ